MNPVRKVMYTTLGASALFLAACSHEPKETAAVNDFRAEMYSAQFERDSVENLLKETLDDIDNSLNTVFKNSPKAKVQTAANGNLSMQREDILKNIQLAGKMLSDNRKRISKLKSQLGKYKLQNTELSKRLEEADTRIADYEQQLAGLRQELADKNTQLADLSTKAEKLQFESIMQKEFADKYENELNTAYYTKGSSRELKKSGVIVKEGGVLGLGATEELNDQYPERMFAKIDIRKTTSIPVNAKKARLVTTHPDGTYEMKEVNGQIASLEIKNPDEFWKISRHMVLEVR